MRALNSMTEGSNIGKTIGITIFEKQLLRTYLLSDPSFLKELSKFNSVSIFTSRNLQPIIISALNDYRLFNIRIVTFDYYRDSLVSRLVGGLLRWIEPEKTTLAKAHQETRVPSRIFRLFLYYGFRNRPFFKRFLRLLFRVTFNKNRAKKFIDSAIDSSDLAFDSIFVTSLTNYWEDLPIALLFKSQSKIIGTVRSWDNLLAHGALRFWPDVFISHSSFMTETAMKNQAIPSDSIRPLSAPTYQEKFLKHLRLRGKSARIIGYACMGLEVNPDDYNFVNWLIKLWESEKLTVSLVIFQHPSFPINLGLIANKYIEVKTYSFESVSLQNYYSTLASFGLVIGGGTTALLDSAVCGVPVTAIGFEVVNQEYWNSGLRYIDTHPHTREFFTRLGIRVLKNKDELIKAITGRLEITPIDLDRVEEFSGSLKHQTFEGIINELTFQAP